MAKSRTDKYNSREGIITQKGECIEEYSDRAETQKQLNELVELCFVDKTNLNIDDFQNVIENISSDMFLCLFSLIKAHFPTLTQFKSYEQRIIKDSNHILTPKSSARKLAAPKVLSKFSPISKIVKFSTPKLESRTLSSLNPDSTEEEKGPVNLPYFQKISTKIKSGFAPNLTKTTPSLSSVVRLPNVKEKLQDITKSPTTFLMEPSQETILFCECGNTISNLDVLLCDDCIIKRENPKCEGYLYIMKESLKKYWFSIDKKDIICYETKESAIHKEISSLIGCFIKEEPLDMDLYPFSILVTSKKSRKYYAKTESDQKLWVNTIKKVIGYANISDYYDINEVLGKGKFGLVKAAIHKKTGKSVAIKSLNKLIMNSQDLELVKEEIEIMKVCQHPNLIRLLDVFENAENIYIVMELMKGGDLFAYLEKCNFVLPEKTAARITHSLAAGLYYLHNYGIVHRDLKPENVLMTSNKPDSDVKIMDFGLSKMIGPSELCTEPFGTISYVSPEVLQQKPYGKGVDVWSLGILAYLMMVGSLPFDNEDDREVAR